MIVLSVHSALNEKTDKHNIEVSLNNRMATVGGLGARVFPSSWRWFHSPSQPITIDGYAGTAPPLMSGRSG
jgi:hypothetical protein